MDLITRTLLLLLVSCIAITIQNTQNTTENNINDVALRSHKNPNDRIPRALFLKKKKKVGPFRQVFGIFFEQWNDTKYTWDSINTMLNENFPPEGASTTTTTTTTASPNAGEDASKPPPFRISRQELARLLKRNLRGLMRLYDIELADALKQSRITEREFNRNVSKEVSKFL